MEDKRRQLEATKMRELNKRRIDELTQEAAQIQAKEIRDREGIQKEIMKSVIQTSGSNKIKSTAATTGKNDGGKSNKEGRKDSVIS